MSERLEQLYKGQVLSKLMSELKLGNAMAAPKLKKIVVAAGIGKFKEDPKLIESATTDLRTITGQTPKITKAKVAISAFKLRANDVVGLVVTLRGEKMWSFLDKLVSIVLPRVRDFRGIDKSSFDGRGNLSLGFTEHTVFPEIDANKVDRMKSLGVTITTTAGTDERGKLLLSSLGFPFKKEIGRS